MNRMTRFIAFSAVCTALSALSLLVSSGSYAASVEKPKNKSKLSEYWTDDEKNFNLAVENGSEFTKVSDDVLQLKSGTFLVESEGAVTLRLPMSELQLKPKTIILARVSKNSERFYCLLDEGVLTISGKAFLIHCGEECLLSDHNPRPNEITGEYDVWVRQGIGSDISDDRKLAMMEFSIIQAMEREPLLRQVSHSKHGHDRALRDRLLKAVAVLNFVTNRHGQYRPLDTN